MTKRWEPLPNGEHESQHTRNVVQVDGEWLTAIEHNLNGIVYEANVALTDNVRLCRLVEADDAPGVTLTPEIAQTIRKMAQWYESGANEEEQREVDLVNTWLAQQGGGDGK